jgi:genome maintenance exonuclease 1
MHHILVYNIDMYKERFQYQPIPRQTVDGSRRYVTPDGMKLPSVTTILDATKSQESRQALHDWRKRVGVEKAQAITTEAANRGTRLHSYLERYIKDGVIPDRGSNPFSWPSHTMAQEIIGKGLVNVDEFWGVEVGLYFPKIYAGTTDCVGIHGGQESIIDFKQSNREKKREWIEDYFTQLAAYGESHNELHGTNIRKGVIMMSVKPELDKDGLMVGKPQYLEFILEGHEYEKYTNIWWKKVEEYYTRFG